VRRERTGSPIFADLAAHGRAEQATQAEVAEAYAEYFPAYIETGIKAEQLDPELGRYDIDRLAVALQARSCGCVKSDPA
jgi:hypothetical protein